MTLLWQQRLIDLTLLECAYVMGQAIVFFVHIVVAIVCVVIVPGANGCVSSNKTISSTPNFDCPISRTGEQGVTIAEQRLDRASVA